MFGGFCREQEGRELLEECLLICERYKGKEHPSSVTHLLNLASSYSRSKNFVEAERLLRTSLQIMSKMVAPEDQSLTVPMLHLAITLYHLKRDEEAERLALEAVHIRENAFGKQSLPVGKWVFFVHCAIQFLFIVQDAICGPGWACWSVWIHHHHYLRACK